MIGRGEDVRSGKGRGVLGLVWGVLALTAASLVGVAVAVVGARDEVRSDLDYDTFLASVDELLERSRADTLLRFHRLEARLPDGRWVQWDTLAVAADPARYPSLAEGGFLFDQVERYNRFQRERWALARERPRWFDRLAPYNPSIFRKGRDGEGGPHPSRSAEAWSLRVPSPSAGRWAGEIRARDARRGVGLMGGGTVVPLDRPTRLFRTVQGRRQRCEFEPAATEIRAFCLSEQRVPQAIFRLAGDDPTPRTAVAGWSDLRVDGRAVAPGDSVPVRAGSILRLDPLDPLLLGEFRDGVLSSGQWVNGRRRRITAAEPPLDLFGPFDEPVAAEGPIESDETLEVSIHARATGELTRSLAEFLREEVTLPVDVATIVLARIPDGAVVAVAEVGRRRSPGRTSLFEPVAPGSAVKPLLAAAILSRRPDLGSLEIPARAGDVRRVLGLPAVPAGRALASALNCGAPGDGWIDLRYFVRCSHNGYAAALVAAGLLPGDGWRQVPDDGLPRAHTFRWGAGTWSGLDGGGWPDGAPGGRFARSLLLTSPLAEGLDALFEVSPDPVVTDRVRRSGRIWEGLRLADGTPVSAPWAARPSVSRPQLLASAADEATDLGLLYRYAVGAWENRWTLPDLAMAFGRVVTDRRIDLSFAVRDPVPAPPTTGLEGARWYETLLEGLRDVARDGTAAGLDRAWRGVGLPGGVLAKTGTLAEAVGSGGGDGDLFAKSLLFAVGESASTGARPLRCGVVGGVYVRFAAGPRRGPLPAAQVGFARERLGAFLRERWASFGICPQPG